MQQQQIKSDCQVGREGVEDKVELVGAKKVLKEFAFKEVLGGDPSRKSLFILLEKEEKKAVLICDKQAFEENGTRISSWLASAKLEQLAANDRYFNCELELEPKFSKVKSTLIFPAREFDVEKYRRQEFYVIYETPEDYKEITLPFLNGPTHKENLNWVYNFLDKKSESDRIVFENPDKNDGFILAPDLKWNGRNMDELYLLAIAHRRDLRSVRELTPKELPLLENIRDQTAVLIKEKYGLAKSQLKMYLHYQPTFYHLHVHIVNVKYDAPGLGCTSILLDTAIGNIKMFPDYYGKATLAFIRKKNDPLYQKYLEAGKV